MKKIFAVVLALIISVMIFSVTAFAARRPATYYNTNNNAYGGGCRSYSYCYDENGNLRADAYCYYDANGNLVTCAGTASRGGCCSYR